MTRIYKDQADENRPAEHPKPTRVGREMFHYGKEEKRKPKAEGRIRTERNYSRTRTPTSCPRRDKRMIGYGASPKRDIEREETDNVSFLWTTIY